MKVQLLTQPFGARVGDELIHELRSGRWERFRCAVAFAKLSGVRYLDAPLRKFGAGGGVAEVAIGIDSGGTSFEAASQLAGAVRGDGRLLITTEIGTASFHPKLYAFSSRRRQKAVAVVGSSNLTQGGLFDNHECSTVFSLDLAEDEDAALFAALETALDAWHDVDSGLAIPADGALLRALHSEGRLPLESWIRSRRSATAPSATRGVGAIGSKRRPRRGLPKPERMGPPLVTPPAAPPAGQEPQPAALAVDPEAGPIHDALYMDIATRTVTTEIYLAKRALREDPAFFRHPFTGWTEPKKKSSPSQPQLDPKPLVEIRLLGASGTPDPDHVYSGHELKMWEYVKGRANGDVRVTIPQPMRRSLPEGCILEMRRRPIPAGLDYRLDFLTPGSSAWAAARAKAVLPLPNSLRKMGWD